MMRLAWAGMRHTASSWLWTLLCAVVGAGCAAGALSAMFAAFTATRDAGDDRMMSASIALGGNVVFFTVLAAIGVVASTVNLTLTTQRREHALWLILGMPKRTVRRILRTQMLIVGCVAGLVATPLSAIVSRIALRQWEHAGLNLHHPATGLQAWQVGLSMAAGVIPCLLGGSGAVRRAAKTPEVAAFRAAAEKVTKMGLVRAVLALALLAGVIGLWIPAFGSTLSGGLAQNIAFAFAADLFLVGLLLLLGPWVFPALMRLWTALVPSRSISWRLAVAACRMRASRSVSTVLPFALSLAVFSLFIVMGKVMPSGTSGLQGVVVVLGWVFLTSWVGGLSVIALVGRDRHQDAALVQVAGATPSVTLRMTLAEGFIYAVTAVLFGAGILATSLVTMCVAGRHDLGHVCASLPWGQFAGLAALTAVMPVAALIWPAMRIAAASPTQSLRG